LEERVQDPEKRWKFNEGDLEERKLWKDYEDYLVAFENMLGATSTAHAPWYVVPANRKWYRNLVVASTIVEAMTVLNLKQPPEPAGVDFSTLKIV
jgi:polyphosphate kinase 2 (PPK2 family)